VVEEVVVLILRRPVSCMGPARQPVLREQTQAYQYFQQVYSEHQQVYSEYQQ
jgi:hypothetical protein